jgi:hypothetical protein
MQTEQMKAQIINEWADRYRPADFVCDDFNAAVLREHIGNADVSFASLSHAVNVTLRKRLHWAPAVQPNQPVTAPVPEKPAKFFQGADGWSNVVDHSKPQPESTATAKLVENIRQKAALASCLAALTVEMSAARGTAFGLPHSRKPAAEREAIGKVKRDFIGKYPQFEQAIRNHEA